MKYMKRTLSLIIVLTMIIGTSTIVMADKSNETISEESIAVIDAEDIGIKTLNIEKEADIIEEYSVETETEIDKKFVAEVEQENDAYTENIFEQKSIVDTEPVEKEHECTYIEEVFFDTELDSWVIERYCSNCGLVLEVEKISDSKVSEEYPELYTLYEQSMLEGQQCDEPCVESESEIYYCEGDKQWIESTWCINCGHVMSEKIVEETEENVEF